MIEFKLTSFTTSDGSVTSLPPAGVVVFVGPNNAGKSQALKDIVGHLRSGNDYVGRTVTTVAYEKSGSRDDAHAWARATLPMSQRNGVDLVMVDGWGEVGPTDIAGQWQNTYPPLGILTDLMVMFADGTTRLTAANSQPSLDLRAQFPTHPIQRAYADPALEEQFRSVSKAAFGLDLAVDRYAGAQIPLRVGTRPDFTHNEGMPTQNYLDGLSAMSQLDAQGDGIRSFLGLLTQLIAGHQKAIFVDEPEAFLHPPQARLLGRMLAERASHQQVFLSTHSAAILQGVLEAGSPVTIVRLTREGAINRASTLADSAVSELWSDPLLRYSNVLEGLFYDAVVLCESDSDCRYYGAVRDHLFPEGTGDGRRLELHYVQSGGKARLAVVIRALKAVRVPVVVVTDFDILRGENDVKRTLEALGVDPVTILPRRKQLESALTLDTKPLQKIALKDAFAERLSTMADSLSGQDLEALRRLLKSETGWDKAKRAGLAAVPQGDPSKYADSLLADLAKAGLLVVPVGELERFAPSVPGHGPSWVNAVLEEGLHMAPSADARSFITQIEETAKVAIATV